MPISLKKGQKVSLSKENPGLTKVLVGLGWDVNAFDTGGSFDLDAAAFLLGENGKITRTEDFVFYGNLQHPSGAVEHLGDNLTGAGDGDDEQIKVDLSLVPENIQRVAFTVTIYDADVRRQNFGQVNNAFIRIVDESNGQEILRYDLGEDFSIETAAIFGELYKHNGEWKFNAIGSGYQGGLAALCANYGVEVEDCAGAERRKKEAFPMAISLEKGKKVNLRKQEKTGLGEILVNLNWNNKPAKKGFLGSLFGGGSKPIDLDLGCLYELKNGRKGTVQALGNAFGSLQQEPYIALDGDDRTGAVATGENLRIDGNHIADIKRVLVYTYIYEGVANWQQADAVVTIRYPGAEDLVVKMDDYQSNQIMCGLVLLENVNDETFSVEKIVQFYRGHQALDQAFGWGMRWTPGRK